MSANDVFKGDFMKSYLGLTSGLGFIIFVSGATLTMAANEQPSSIHEVQEYNAIEEIKCEIENISSHITLAIYQEGDAIELLELYNERGIRYFCIGSLENALDDFNHVLNVLENRQETVEPPLALALWGRMLCHAHQNHEEEAIHDLDLFQSYFLEECSPCKGSQFSLVGLSTLNAGSREHWHEIQNTPLIFENLPLYSLVNTRNTNLYYSEYVRPVAEFANPNERLSTEECKQRVKGTADIMRLLTVRIPSPKLSGLVNLAISHLEDAMNSCCHRNRWTDCLSPILDAYNYMKKCMDKGAAIAPQIIWPGR